MKNKNSIKKFKYYKLFIQFYVLMVLRVHIPKQSKFWENIKSLQFVIQI